MKGRAPQALKRPDSLQPRPDDFRRTDGVGPHREVPFRTNAGQDIRGWLGEARANQGRSRRRGKAHTTQGVCAAGRERRTLATRRDGVGAAQSRLTAEAAVPQKQRTGHGPEARELITAQHDTTNFAGRIADKPGRHDLGRNRYEPGNIHRAARSRCRGLWKIDSISIGPNRNAQQQESVLIGLLLGAGRIIMILMVTMSRIVMADVVVLTVSVSRSRKMNMRPSAVIGERAVLRTVNLCDTMRLSETEQALAGQHQRKQQQRNHLAHHVRSIDGRQDRSPVFSATLAGQAYASRPGFERLICGGRSGLTRSARFLPARRPARILS